MYFRKIAGKIAGFGVAPLSTRPLATAIFRPFPGAAHVLSRNGYLGFTYDAKFFKFYWLDAKILNFVGTMPKFSNFSLYLKIKEKTMSAYEESIAFLLNLGLIDLESLLSFEEAQSLTKG